MQRQKVLLVLPNFDINYTTSLTPIFSKYFTKLHYENVAKIEMKSQLAIHASKVECNLIATTSLKILKLIDPTLQGSVSDNIGTVLEFDGIRGAKLRVILLPNFKTLYTQNHGAFLLNHYCKKLAHGGVLKKDRFEWDFVYPHTLNQIKNQLEYSELCAVDIETDKFDLKITSVAYTILYKSYGKLHTATFVIKCSPDNYPFCIDAMRVLNSTPIPKIMQNGRYDSTYFLRFDAPLTNYLYDTYHMMHCLFPELPRDLSFISTFFLDDFVYWKDEAGNNLYEYNGKDTHNTLWVWLAMIKYIEDYNCQYAYKNYLLEFPTVFPCISCGLEGMVVDEERRQELRQKEVERKEAAQKRLAYLVSEPNINPNSPKQIGLLMKALGYKTGKGTDVKELNKWKWSNGIYTRIVECITDYRQAGKAISTYFDVSLLNGKLFYALDPGGTDTGRMASKESNFWCGTQIQNIPPYARKMIVAEDGWEFVGVDKAQSESYCTGYIAQEPALINAVTTSADFHCENASKFFGIPFEKLYSVEGVIDGKTGEIIHVLNKEIRTLAKRTNHGANYNMGAYVLLETMGLPNVLKAKQLLRLPANYNPLAVCTYLLGMFDRTYPRLRGDWQTELVNEFALTGKISLPCVGWTRRSFLKPHKSKSDLNALVAHKPQCLSVMLLNKAFVRVWRDLQCGKYNGQLRLKAQIHDEILSIIKPEVKDECAKDIADYMTIPTKVEGRLMTIPSTIASGKYWNEAK